MTGERPGGILEYLYRLTAPGPAGEATDGQLLERFVRQRDEAAFAVLVRRHGPLVWGVCRRILRHTQDAEDAFQATFLVLARKAASVGKRESVRSYLYTVAYRAALHAREAAARRRAREQPLEDVAMPPHEDAGPDLRPVLDEEIGRLPERYRVPLLLCHLEGKTQEEAARLLGCPRATVATRLARGKDRLRARLARRGLGASAGIVAAGLHDAVAPPVPDAVIEATLRAVAGTASPRALALVDGVLRGLVLARWRAAAVVLLMVGAVGSGAGVLAARTQGPAADEPRAEAKAAAAVEAAPAPQPRPQPQAQPPSKTAELAEKLTKPINFSGWDQDPKSTLEEALDHLADRYDLTFDVDEAAFKADRCKDVRSAAIARTAIPKMINVSLDKVLRKFLDRIPVRSRATFLIRGDIIEITTEAAVRAQLGLDDKAPLLPLVHLFFEQRPLDQALREASAGTIYSVVIDPRAAEQTKLRVTATLANEPLDTAVRVLADMGGLQVVQLDAVFYVTTPENAARLRAEQERRQLPPAEQKKGRPTADAGSRARHPTP